MVQLHDPIKNVRVINSLSPLGLPVSNLESRITHFSDVDESTHKILVAERIDSLLSLLPRRIFHDPTSISHCTNLYQNKKQHIPASLHFQRTKSQSVNPTSNQYKAKKTSHFYALAPTFDIPFGSSNTSAKRTSPAVNHSIS